MNTSQRPVILSAQDLRFAYPDQPPLTFGGTLSIGEGITQVFGDTGSGKSTLLRLMAGDLKGGGSLALLGARLDADRDAYLRRVFFCDPATDAFDPLSVLECSARLRADDADFSEPIWRAAVEGFALTPHIGKKMFMLSTGSKRKVWLAAALASGRPLTLLDEPTGGLDAASIRYLWSALSDIGRRPGRAVVVASSDRIDRVELAAVIELPIGTRVSAS